MKITKRQLKRIIKEACALSGDASGDHKTHIGPQPEVPSPQDYDAVRGFMNTNPDIVDLGINMVMDQALEGGVNESLNLDGHGKSWSSLILSLEVEVP